MNLEERVVAMEEKWKEEEIRRAERKRIADLIFRGICVIGGLLGAASFITQYLK